MTTQRDPKFILASASLRRQEILSITGLKFDVINPDIDESNLLDHDGITHAKTLALKKARRAAEMVTGQFYIISADTLVLLNDRIFGKPKDDDEAKDMLMELSGKTHSVVTALCVYNTVNQSALTDFRKTDVTFKSLDSQTIRNYIHITHPMDFAGAYAIQGQASMLIEGISGDYYNVVGLPLTLLYDMLLKTGFDLLSRRWIKRI